MVGAPAWKVTSSKPARQEDGASASRRPRASKGLKQRQGFTILSEKERLGRPGQIRELSPKMAHRDLAQAGASSQRGPLTRERVVVVVAVQRANAGPRAPPKGPPRAVLT